MSTLLLVSGAGFEAAVVGPVPGWGGGFGCSFVPGGDGCGFGGLVALLGPPAVVGCGKGGKILGGIEDILTLNFL